MKMKTTLVLGADKWKGLENKLIQAGLVPLVRDGIQEALEEIRHKPLVAIVIDRDNINFDVLEFVLNVRDLDNETPIIMIGQPSDKRWEGVLMAQRLVFCLINGPEGLEEEIKKLFSGKETKTRRGVEKENSL